MTKKTWKRRETVQLSLCPTPDLLWKRIQHTGLPSLLSRDEAFSTALAIQLGDELVRSEIQARVLADQPRAEIATRMGITIEAVAEYEDWWFDVRSRFEATGWITHEAIQRRPTGELLAGDTGAFWRWIGFHFGSSVLEPYLAAASTESLRFRGLDAYWQKDSTLDVDLRLFVLAQRLPVPSTRKQWNLSIQCQETLLVAKTLPTEELLCPLALDMSLFSEPEIFVPDHGSQAYGITQALEGLTTDFGVEPFQVVQTLVL